MSQVLCQAALKLPAEGLIQRRHRFKDDLKLPVVFLFEYVFPMFPATAFSFESFAASGGELLPGESI